MRISYSVGKNDGAVGDMTVGTVNMSKETYEEPRLVIVKYARAKVLKWIRKELGKWGESENYDWAKYEALLTDDFIMDHVYSAERWFNQFIEDHNMKDCEWHIRCVNWRALWLHQHRSSRTYQVAWSVQLDRQVVSRYEVSECFGPDSLNNAFIWNICLNDLYDCAFELSDECHKTRRLVCVTKGDTCETKGNPTGLIVKA
jgi:hypothetical protein